MTTKPIVTLTLNSSVDVQWEVDEMVPERKLRSSSSLNFPGGGGINVSRVIKTLGGLSISIYTAGWFTGHFMRELVEAHGLLTQVVPIAGQTRASATVFERSTGQEYRITPPGPELTETEWRACLDAALDYEADYIVATGSLPRGVPEDFYARLAAAAKKRGTRVVLDTSGTALSDALAEGVHVVKPNLRELEHLVGGKAITPQDQESMCRKIIGDGRADMVALTLGAEGALLVWSGGAERLQAPDIAVKSAVGAGDSFVAGITFGLARGMSEEDAFALGVATGTATVMTAGTELCHRGDVDRLYQQITTKPLQV